MVMELASGGELRDYVEQSGRIDEYEARQIIEQVVLAIDRCHTVGIVHRDMKLENVLFKDSSRMQVKVIDFGISGSSDKADRSNAGTIRYMPPEMHLGTGSQAELHHR